MEDRPTEAMMRLDAHSLRGLAHPLRVRILEVLRSDGPATATMLANRLGEDSGNMSWHLRQLATHGFIAEDKERGTKRERWWFALHKYIAVEQSDFLSEQELRGLLSTLKKAVITEQFRRAEEFTDQDWPARWQEAAAVGYWRFRLSSSELGELRTELAALFERWEARRAEDPERSDGEDGPDARDVQDVVLQFQGFPYRPVS
ncbi:winged helix-turn-helix domain-containing protein [Streptomyces sp. NPDC057697]|uniref:winged helix-turn-helix domain-containing protein n=1 Tax=Streptomyces sp. NPDC057697 TaxID=3346219 RepID=UPI0036AFCCF2